MLSLPDGLARIATFMESLTDQAVIQPAVCVPRIYRNCNRTEPNLGRAEYTCVGQGVNGVLQGSGATAALGYRHPCASGVLSPKTQMFHF